MNRGWWRH